MAFQLHFTDLFESPGSASLSRQIDPVATEASLGERGAVFTRREVAEFILDLVGYTVARPLHQMRLLEPSCGQGSFLLPAVSRLLTAWRVAQRPVAVQNLADAIRAVELHGESLATTHRSLEARLREEGLSAAETAHLLDAWLVEGDFLLAQFDQSFDFAVGNPPYVRQELIPAAQLREYRRRFETIYDRADLYVPFIEKSLSHLGPGGILGFICTDRWMKNRYGGPLRSLVARCYHLKYHVEIESEAAFERSVLTYPAITVIGRTAPGPTRTARAAAVEMGSLENLAAALTGAVPGTQVAELNGIMRGAGPWILRGSDVVSMVRRLEASYPTLEATGCRVGIGVATGADKVFIKPDNELDVEPERKLPLVMTADIVTGKVLWTGRSVLNPFAEDGTLVSPENFPRFAAYLSRHETVLRNRHVALRNPSGWYRTIDRIHSPLTRQHKLLVPDIKGQAHVVMEEGRFYPHHNLYYVTSSQWDLRALQAVLLSGIAQMFISVYSTPMQGGFLRFQAQYLRRIRLPQWSEIPEPSRRRLVLASQSGDLVACQAAVAAVYDLTAEEQSVLDGLTFSSLDASGSRKLPRPNPGGRASVLGKPPARERETSGPGGSPRQG